MNAEVADELKLSQVVIVWGDSRPPSWEVHAVPSSLHQSGSWFCWQFPCQSAKMVVFHQLPADIFWWLSPSHRCELRSTVASPSCPFVHSEGGSQSAVQLLTSSFKTKMSCCGTVFFLGPMSPCRDWLSYLCALEMKSFWWIAGRWGETCACIVDFVRVFHLQRERKQSLAVLQFLWLLHVSCFDSSLSVGQGSRMTRYKL